MSTILNFSIENIVNSNAENSRTLSLLRSTDLSNSYSDTKNIIENKNGNNSNKLLSTFTNSNSIAMKRSAKTITTSTNYYSNSNSIAVDTVSDNKVDECGFKSAELIMKSEVKNGETIDNAPIQQTLSYFDVFLPHIEMASNNPLLSLSNSVERKFWSQQWIDLLQHSTSQNFHKNSFELFLQPIRKNKRIRTAFTPYQLVQLQKAFQLNHYVIGSERKQLAIELSLTETQVKVWFQNRRTKHKRIKCDRKDVHLQGGNF